MTGEHGSTLSVFEQCKLLGIPRSTFYAQKGRPDRSTENAEKEGEHVKRSLIVFNAWLNHSTYGYRKMSEHLRTKEFCEWATERIVRDFYRELLIHGERPVFKTTRPSKHPYGKFPYLLRNRKIRYCNEVWATDITYIKMANGKTVYFTAVIDLYSRKILSWRLSDTMQAEFCIECVDEAIENYGIPAIFNTDNGSQYTCKNFIELLQAYDIQISMDGVGRCKDNIIVERTWRTLKYEWIFLRDYQSYEELENGLEEFVNFFNQERLHQSLDYKTPDEVYEAGTFPGIEDVNIKNKVA